MQAPRRISGSTARHLRGWFALGFALLASSCGGGTSAQAITAESCMLCHNGSPHDNYAGPGLENPHPFPGADNLRCTVCHGGNPDGTDADHSHVPPPPQIGDDQNQINNRTAYFNRLTLAGIDKFPDYTVDGRTYSALDYLQFVNPGDLRVVTNSRSCGLCHQGHAMCVADSLLATEAGILSGASYAIGVENRVPESQGLYEDTAADMGFRAADDPVFDPGSAGVGEVARLLEYPVFSVRGAQGPDAIFENLAVYDAVGLSDDQHPDGRAITGSPLANLFHEQISFTCGDCHLGSAGANNRYGDFRSSGCTACHMRYSQDGRSRSGDANVNRFEPANPDQIQAPERPHVRRHMVLSTAKTLPSGEFIEGIDDWTCAGCHQGSNRTVMQYWGIRLDQNEDVHRFRQYPANPVSFEDTGDDPRLFDPVVNNNTFNGRRDRQYLLFEDYDGDALDDTPPDVHYEAGLGCIDCHGSYDIHGGDVENHASGAIKSRMEQAVAIRCENCHGDVSSYAATTMGVAHDGQVAEIAMDSKGNPLPHVVREADGNYYLYSRLTGDRHYLSQTRDVVVDSGKLNPFTGEPVYSAKASYAMGRADTDPSNGIGPKQTNGDLDGFAHGDSMSCTSCHASWSNSCIGCHLGGEYDNGNNFSNITGERIIYKQANADFVYQTPVPFQLGIGPHNKIVTISPNTEAFYHYQDQAGNFSEVFTFSDRNGGGSNTARAQHPAMSHNAMMPHSIRGKIDAANEGPRYCVACHLTTEGLANWGGQYANLRNAMATPGFPGLDLQLFQLLQTHIGRNPGNQLNSPLWVHMVAGLGTGLFLFDENGCPVNPLDNNDARIGCNGISPADTFNLARVARNLDRIVNELGVSGGSNNHPMLSGGMNRRDGAIDPNLAGPLGATLIDRLTNPDPQVGIVLDSWIDADGVLHGDPANFANDP